MTYTPPVYVPVTAQAAKCSECGKDEDIKRVCRHCGVEYVDKKTPKWKSCLIGMTIITGMILATTLLCWVAECDHNDWRIEDKGLKDPTYVEFVSALAGKFSNLELW
ncbi:hypothetical protein KAR91_21190 [Candidatus Pacearchaeota archaeon]|nr:hypothetical protein [Candidatus Pacearchaeota archaeon]